MKRSALLLASTILASSFAYAQQEEAVAIEEIVVTAQKRAENLQKVPMAITAFSTKKLEELNVVDFKDYSKLLPSLSFQGQTPGGATVYFRGIASGENNNHSGPLPSVGTYLDEQPITTIGGTLDIHMYDMAGLEALAGPQGTLYGASSQAGTVRLKTNKPKIGEFEAAYDVTANNVEHGGMGYMGEGLVNLPISDNTAIRMVGWYKKDAGYIDNVPGTRTYDYWGTPSSITINNSKYVEKDYNDVDTLGGRAALRVDLSEDWTITPTFMAQRQKVGGVFSYDKLNKGDLNVSTFLPEDSKDKWYQAAFTAEGKVGSWDVVYAGAYMNRRYDSLSDYSDYSDYYNDYDNYLVSNGSGPYYTAYDDNGNFIDQSQWVKGIDKYTKQSHEFRVSSTKENRFRVILGAFYQRQYHNIEQRYGITGLGADQSVTGQEDIWWLTKQKRVDRDSALFGEATYDIIPDKLTATAGARMFKYRNTLIGFWGFKSRETPAQDAAHPNNCFAASWDPTQLPCINLDKVAKGNGETYKFNLTWNVTDKHLVYGTFSRGFRPGGINRRGSLPAFDPDWVDNFEFGWKTSWLDNRVRWNGSIYRLNWKNMQFSYLGANGLTEIKNAGNATVKGIETDITIVPVEGWTITASGAYTDASLDENYCKYLNPTNDCTIPDSVTGRANKLYAPAGTQLPVSAKFKGNVNSRYSFDIGDMKAHVQGSVTFNGKVWGDLRTEDRVQYGRQQDWVLADFSAGVAKNNWNVELFLENAFDKRADMGRGSQCGFCTTTYFSTVQPRTVGIKFGQKF